ncbi:unnamed protein product [Ambrosiozyma monospora]|uniref:Unnamed protein product n=1 Tax=Ambrosiozyma monospora TaxID=43982 RepID=A0ACB5U9V3_AMBMO|nr:unnamed protein product [Ambrosiozyma monospora]
MVPTYDSTSTSPSSKNTDPATLTARRGMKIKPQGETRQQHLRAKKAESFTATATGNNERMLKCPLTNKMIPESQFQQHINILLRDPKYKEEKQRYEAKFKYGSNITTDQIYENIKRLADDNGGSDSKRRKY